MGVAAIPYVAMAAAAALQYNNTQQTARRQDGAAADAILNQSRIQKQADGKVNDTVTKLAASTADSARQQRLSDYMAVLQRNKDKATAGLTPTVGSSTFKADAATAANDAQGYANTNAGLMARMDAGGLQRQNEGFAYGQLGTDLGLLNRDSQGQNFLDQIRMQGIRRNAKMDLAAGLLNAYAGSQAGAAGGGAASGSTTSMGGGYTANLPY